MPRSRAGFTLIEVLLSITILATLSALAARSISQAVASKAKLQSQIDDVSKMRDALRLMERDINLAFHHKDDELELLTLLNKKNVPLVKAGTIPTPTNPPPPREAERKDPSTNFMGAEDQMSFVTMNNARMMKDSRQADFMEVGYALKSCHSASGKQSSNCLWRRSSPVVDDDVTTGGDEVVLLENVTEFSLKYIGIGKQDWVSSWKSDKGGDAVTKNSFPKAVQISLTVQKPAADNGAPGKKYSMQIVASIHFPNNLEPTNGATNGSPTPATNQTQ